MSEMDLRGDFDGRSGVLTRHCVETATGLAGFGVEASRVASDRIKYAMDIVLSVVGMIVLLPLILMVCALIYVTQGRPIFIFHRRIGRNGVLFSCIKFRTMVSNGDEVLAEHLATDPAAREEWNASRKLKNDPRVTPLGATLRKTSIDEVPQLWNVLRGEMSLVGPRPIVPSEVELFGAHFADYIRVRPGLTGLWQVSGRSETSYSARVALDVRYVDERSAWGDLVIMAKTIPAVLSAHGSY